MVPVPPLGRKGAKPGWASWPWGPISDCSVRCAPPGLRHVPGLVYDQVVGALGFKLRGPIAQPLSLRGTGSSVGGSWPRDGSPHVRHPPMVSRRSRTFILSRNATCALPESARDTIETHSSSGFFSGSGSGVCCRRRYSSKDSSARWGIPSP